MDAMESVDSMWTLCGLSVHSTFNLIYWGVKKNCFFMDSNAQPVVVAIALTITCLATEPCVLVWWAKSEKKYRQGSAEATSPKQTENGNDIQIATTTVAVTTTTTTTTTPTVAPTRQ
jgi:hypothetical protein